MNKSIKQCQGRKKMETITRRGFMKASAVLMGGVIGSLAIKAPGIGTLPAYAGDLEFKESSCGTVKTGGFKILVAYGSMHGSTGGIADEIGHALCQEGIVVDVRTIENAGNPPDYDAVIVGSAVRSSRWLPEAVDFVTTHRELLAQKPVAYFVSCLTLYHDTPENRNNVRGFLNPVLESIPEVKPLDIGLFAGVLDYEKYNIVTSIIMKRKMKKYGIPEGDFRNWDHIRGWARSLRPMLLSRKSESAA
jgi:menaquinone-dependent protoporphyrinogen oxidase